MIKIIKIILYIPVTVIKAVVTGWYKCLSYGNEDQLLLLMVSTAVFTINVIASKKTDVEDIIVMLTYITIMNHFSKLTIENLYLKGDLAKVITSILHRQDKANRKTAKDVEKEVRKIGSQQRPTEEQQPRIRTIFVEQPQQKQELPKNEPSDPTKIVELRKDEYKIKNENFETEEF